MNKVVQEGKAIINIATKDVATKNQEVFYNPVMELNRTISVLLLKAIKKKHMHILLPLAGTGVRGIRFLLELPKNAISGLIINDVNPKATQYMNKNLVENKLEKEIRVNVTNKEANNLLVTTEHGFDYIDIDPFGCPNFLLDNAIRKLKGAGILAVTATDTAALAGTYPSTCKTKYWAESSAVPARHELGLRILARKVQLMGMQHDKALIPILTYHHEHYYRIYFLCQRGRTKAATLYRHNKGMHSYCLSCGNFVVDEQKHSHCPLCKSKKLNYTGPLYTGALQDKEVLKAIKKINKEKNVDVLCTKLLLEEEVEQVGHFDFHDLSNKHKHRTEKFEQYAQRLKTYPLVRTATNQYGFKTTAPHKDVLALFQKEA
jgi:tRNA (guanine26-N2/guanine27-N2)-dimethyltransferase